MIARTWHGWTRADTIERYVTYVRGTGFREYGQTPSNCGAVPILALERKLETALADTGCAT
jgi:hypothetical protein